MESEEKKNDLQSFLHAIRTTKDIEIQISLLNQIGDLYQLETLDVIVLSEWLVTFWGDSACTGVTNYMLHKTVLHIAIKYLESDTSNCLNQFLILGTKVCTWCTNHFQSSIDGSQEEQNRSLFYQLIVDALSFSSVVISALTKCPSFENENNSLIIQNFMYDALCFTRTLIVDIKRIDLIASEVIKLGQIVLDAAVKICRAYYQTIKCHSSEMNIMRKEVSLTVDTQDYLNHFISMTLCTIRNLYELGTFAASGGGSLVVILNISWKGVVCLLQLSKGFLSDKISVEDIILTLISLSVASLRSAAEAWSASSMETVSLAEAKRTFLPVKFYLINTVRISSEYPSNAMNIFKEIVRCVVLISSLRVLLCKESHLTVLSEAMAELLEPTSFLLLHQLVTSTEVNSDSKLQLLEYLFPHGVGFSKLDPLRETDITASSSSLLDVFGASSDALQEFESLQLGKVFLFLYFLKSSSSFGEEVIVEISRKLDYLLVVLTNAIIFSSVLGLQIPVFGALGPNSGVVWQPMFAIVLNALKTFMVVAASSKLSWMEIEFFLFHNLFHPHFLCLEIVMELLSFLVRHGQTEKVSQIFGNLCLLLMTIASSDPCLLPLSALRKLARSICDLLRCATSEMVDQVYTAILNEENSDLSSVMYVALMMEGFPLGSLDDDLKTKASSKVISAFVSFLESNTKELGMDSSSVSCNSSLLGLPVHALSSVLSSQQIKSSDVLNDMIISKLLKFAKAVICWYRNAGEAIKEDYAKLLCSILELFSNLRHLYGLDEFGEFILELQSLFMVPDATLSQHCHHSTANFLGSLCHMQLAEDAGNPLCTAIWDLYHLLLRERHWAFVHLAISAFGYFAARTSCTQLWRFVPSDAALSFDVSTGSEAKYENFMAELKGFLEKEGALRDASTCKEQLSHLFKDGMVLGRLMKASRGIKGAPGAQTTESGIPHIYLSKKKRKPPEGIFTGMELLQNGLQVMNNALRQEECMEIKKEFSTHISCLQDVLSQLIILYNTMWDT